MSVVFLICLLGRFGWATFVLFLCFWQRLRALLFWGRRFVFLDKLCIAQHDDELKQQGVSWLPTCQAGC